MPDRDPNPPQAEIVERVRGQDESVIALVGYVGAGVGTDIRLFPDLDLERWMDFPRDSVVDTEPLDPDGRAGRTPVGGRHVVWIKGSTLHAPLFNGELLDDIQGAFEDFFDGSQISAWVLIPTTRYVAARLLDLVPDYDEWWSE